MNKKSNNLLLSLLGVLCLIALIWFLTDFLIADNNQNDPKKPGANITDSTPTINLSDTNWQIREASDKNGNYLVPSASKALTLEFTADKIYARVCNNISGDYQIKDNLISTPGLIATRMACASDLMIIENIFLAVLENNQSLTINSEGNLIISDGADKELLLVKAAPLNADLAGSRWILSHHRADGSWTDDRAYNITLNFEEEILGGKICNSFGGDYQAENGVLSAANIFLTEMLCGDKELMALEENLTRTLNSQATYEFDYDNNLIIKNGDEQQFRFIPAPMTSLLSDTAWKLEAKGNGAVWTDLSKTNVKLTFSANHAGGRACNSFGGDYILEGKQIVMTSSIISTLMYCEDEDLMDAERTISQVLQSDPEYKLDGENLTLISAEGMQLKFSLSEID
jgi:heat shock protein HslJ